jgi:hypothetical protein
VNCRRAGEAALLVVATAITRFVFRSHYLYDIDSVNFALALKRFDPSVHQPHPPGYFLYVYLGRMANVVFHDANAALVAMGIVFSCGAVAMIYAFTGDWFGRNAALFSGMIFVFSPLAWFHGTVALTYIVESFFSALTGYLCWRIYCGTARSILPAAIVVGIAAGFRQSSLLLLCPLLLFSLGSTNRKRAAGGIGALLLTLLAWFIPMLRITGGTAYLSSLTSLWIAVPSRGMIFNSSVVNCVARAGAIVCIYFLCFGCAAILPLGSIRGAPTVDPRKKIFTLVWITPGLLFFTFIYLKFVNSGYLLVLFPPVCAWMGFWASTWFANLRLRGAVKLLVIGGCILTNSAVFLFAPVYCSYGAVRRFEMEIESVIKILPQLASPAETMIVGFDSHFLGYRHAGYYLPDYLTLQFPEVRLTSGPRVFVMKNRNTSLESEPWRPPMRTFILFPLPSGDREYTDYMAQVLKRFSPGEIRMIVRGGREFAVGPVAALHVLFPSSTDPDCILRTDTYNSTRH